jgi:hypothetical protein
MTDGWTPERTEKEMIDAMMKGFSRGSVVPFLGAGVNCCGRPADFTWHADGVHLPVGAELALYLADLSAYPGSDLTERKNLLRVAQYMSIKDGRGTLRDELHGMLDRTYEPTLMHRFFARLPKILKEKNYGRRIAGFELLIVTTNYDDLLEQAFVDEGVEFDLLIYRAENNRGWFWHVKPSGEAIKIVEPNKYTDVSLDVRPVIIKIHGAIDRKKPADDSFVITEDDYIDYLAGMDLSNFLPPAVKTELINSHFLFLGYSLQDWNLRVFLKRIWDEQQKYDYKSWAIQLHADEVDLQLWGKRGVKIIGVSLDDYAGELVRRTAALPEVKP